MADDSNTVVDPNAIEFEVEQFTEGPLKEFKFNVPRFNSVKRATDIYGETVVLNMLHSVITARVRTKVKNDIGEIAPAQLAAKRQELLTKTGNTGVLYTEDQAITWRPEIRELTPKQLMKQAQEAFSKGDIQRGTDLLRQMGELMKKIGEEQAAIAQATAATSPSM